MNSSIPKDHLFLYHFFFRMPFFHSSEFPLLLQRGSQGSNPAIVTLEGAAKDQLLSHDRSLGDDEGTARGERRRRMNAGGAIVVVGAGIKAQLEFKEESTERAPVPAALIRRGV